MGLFDRVGHFVKGNISHQVHQALDPKEMAKASMFGAVTRIAVEKMNLQSTQERIERVVKANINDLLSKVEDPEKILEQAILDMQEDRVKLRQGLATAIITQKTSEKQYEQAQTEVNNWHKKALLALQKGDEELARQCLHRKTTQAATADAIKAELDQQVCQVESLKHLLIGLESQLSEAKTQKNLLTARAQVAKENGI